MMSQPDKRRRPLPRYANSNVNALIPTYRPTIRSPEADGLAKPSTAAGTSNGDSLQAGYEDPARPQANDGANDEGDDRRPHRHRYLCRPWGDVPGTERQPNLGMYRMGTAAAHVGSFVRTSTTPTRLPGSPKPTVHLGAGRPT